MIYNTSYYHFTMNHQSYHQTLKELAHAKIIKKSVILFRVPNMTI